MAHTIVTWERLLESTIYCYYESLFEMFKDTYWVVCIFHLWLMHNWSSVSCKLLSALALSWFEATTNFHTLFFGHVFLLEPSPKDYMPSPHLLPTYRIKALQSESISRSPFAAVQIIPKCQDNLWRGRQAIKMSHI